MTAPRRAGTIPALVFLRRPFISTGLISAFDGTFWTWSGLFDGEKPKMIVLASRGGEVGIQAAIDILRRGGRALDAVEAATRLVEVDLNNHTVGVSGWPNLLGRAELDASIMDGQTLATGAVGSLRLGPLRRA